MPANSFPAEITTPDVIVDLRDFIRELVSHTPWERIERTAEGLVGLRDRLTGRQIFVRNRDLAKSNDLIR